MTLEQVEGYGFFYDGAFYPAGDPAPKPRDFRRHPFASDSIANLSIGSGAIFESPSDTRTAMWLSATTANINCENWSVAYYFGQESDPLTTVVSLESSRTWQIHIPADAEVTGGSDGWGTFVDADGTAYDGYALEKLPNGNWRTRYDLLRYSLLEDGCFHGRRAGNVALPLGLIMPWDVEDLNIPHMLAMSIPTHMLKKTPDSSDGLAGGPNGSGQGWVWPAHGADNAANSDYSGPIAIGSVFGIPPDVDIESFGWSPAGVALARAFQDYGGVVLATASTKGLVAHPQIAKTPALNVRLGQMRSDWTGPSGIQSQLRRITNNVPGPGGFRQFLDINQDPPVWRTSRWPVNHDTVLGGGVRRRPPAPDFEE